MIVEEREAQRRDDSFLNGPLPPDER